MKRVLFIFDRVAHYHRDLFRTLEQSLAENGIELHLLSGMTPDGAKGRTGIKERVVNNEYKYEFREYHLATYTLRGAVGIINRIEEIKPDVVVCFGHVGNMAHWRLALTKRRLGFKLVAWQCGYEYNPGALKNLVLRQFVPRFDHHLAYHSNARNYALTHGARADQVTLMHNTINEEHISVIPKAEARQTIAAKHPQIGDRQILLFVGAVLVEKRIEVILEAMALLAQKNLVLLLVGDGDHLPALRAACASRSDVIFAGAVVDGVGPYFDAAEMYLLPGTGGLGINEAMAHGLPIISGFADGSADDLVIDCENGFRLRTGTAEELADRIVRILDDPDLAERMGKRSRAMITGPFAFRQFVQRITNALRAVAA